MWYMACRRTENERENTMGLWQGKEGRGMHSEVETRKWGRVMSQCGRL